MGQSFDILASEYRPMLLAYLRSLGADAHLAEDLAQETFLGAYRSLSTFDSNGNFGAWLRGIARHKITTHWRSVSRRPLLIDSNVIEGVEEVFGELDRKEEDSGWWSERLAILRACVEKLSDHLKAAIEQVYAHDRSLTEAGVELGASKAAVGQRLSRARTQIRKCINQTLESGDYHE